jgi:hypothetical protein
VALLRSSPRESKPLSREAFDLETLEEAFEVTWAAFIENDLLRNLDSDESVAANVLYCLVLDVVCLLV